MYTHVPAESGSGVGNKDNCLLSQWDRQDKTRNLLNQIIWFLGAAIEDVSPPGQHFASSGVWTALLTLRPLFAHTSVGLGDSDTVQMNIGNRV